MFDMVIFVEIAAPHSGTTFTPAVQSGGLFSLLREILQRQTCVANLTAVLCKARQELLECE